LTLQDDNAADDSVIIIPAKNRSGKKSIDKVEVDEDSEDIKPAGPKKKKR
jgi:kinesin family protein 20